MLSTPQFLQHEQAFHTRLYCFLKGYTSKERLSPDMASTVAGMEGDFDFVEIKSKIQGLEMCLLRQQALLANSYAWMWLDKDCMDHCRCVMDLVLNVQIRSTSTWLERLSMYIYDAVLARSRDNDYWVSLLPHTYLPALSAKVESYKFHCRGIFQTPTAITDRVCQILNEVLRFWLGYSTNTSRLGAYFVQFLISTTCSQDVLLVDGVWLAALHLKQTVLQTKLRHSSLHLSHLEDFYNVLLNSTLADDNSPERKLLTDISSVTHECILLSHRLSTIASPPTEHIPHLDPYLFAPNSYKDILHFVEELLPLVPFPNQLPADCSKLVEQVYRDADKKLPFREHAPSRLRVLDASGPFHPDHIDQPGGFASACIWRGITFGTQSVLEGPNYWTSLHMWKQWAEGKDDTYLCNLSAYGACMSGRNPPVG